MPTHSVQHRPSKGALKLRRRSKKSFLWLSQQGLVKIRRTAKTKEHFKTVLTKKGQAILRTPNVLRMSKHAILQRVKSKKGWKYPTRSITVLTAKQRDKAVKALSYYLGGAEAKKTPFGWTVRSKGYYHYIGA